jgi:hypothetical protein
MIGSGKPVTETYDFAGFTRVEVSDAFEVEIVRGDAFAVEVTVDDNLVDRLIVEQAGDTVRVGLEGGVTLGATTRKATLVLPRLASLNLSGATKGKVGGFASRQALDIEISGASSLVLTDVSAGDTSFVVSGAGKATGQVQAVAVRFAATGASQIEIEGTGGDASLEASGASQLRLSSFLLSTAKVTLSGASSAEVNVARTLDADLSGASRLEYSGSAAIRDIKTSGASQIKRSGP